MINKKDCSLSGNLRRWTLSAIECYDRGCICEGCYLNRKYEHFGKCLMKYSVKELIKRFGEPKKEVKEVKVVDKIGRCNSCYYFLAHDGKCYCTYNVREIVYPKKHDKCSMFREVD